jgi:hypothetical protein
VVISGPAGEAFGIVASEAGDVSWFVPGDLGDRRANGSGL